MLSNIYYYIDARGNNPVKEFIASLPLKERAKVLAYIEELRQQGHNLRRPLADYVGQGIYELRPKHNRVFYFFFMKDSAVLVHAIKKKTDKIPEGDLQLCVKRKSQVGSDYKHIEL
jgi:phage-related protein